jgi:adenylate kinase family enzyme
MKIVVIGAPGSGKTFLSKKIAEILKLTHIESDEIYWKGLDLRKEIENLTEDDNWIVEGHISKIYDIVFPKADKVIIIEGSDILSLIRALMRDWRNPKRAWYNIQFYDRLSRNRNELILKSKSERSDDVLILRNFPEQDDLMTFCQSYFPTLLINHKT